MNIEIGNIVEFMWENKITRATVIKIICCGNIVVELENHEKLALPKRFVKKIN